MKIQCDCGAKYAFDASPEMVRNPVTFACPECGVDLSARLHEAARQEFGNVTGPVALSVSPTVTAMPAIGTAPAPEIAPPPPGRARISPGSPPAPPAARISVQLPSAAAPPPAPAPTPPAPVVRVSVSAPAPAAPGPLPPPPPATAPAPAPVARVNLPASAPPLAPLPAPQPASPAPPPPAPQAAAAPARISLASAGPAAAAPDVKDVRFCPKHPQQRVTEKCRVCGKAICPKCMQLFGYVCSPHCKEKAELQGIEIPVFAGQRDVAQSREWGKVALTAKLAALFIVLIVGVWFWYAWFGSRLKPAFTVRFEDEPAMSGESAVCDGGQIVFLHGAKLARYDLKSKKEVWLRHLVDKKKIADQAAAEVKEMQDAAAKGERVWKIPDVQELTKDMTRSAERRLELRVRGQNIWVASNGKATRYDWETGEPKQEVEFTGGFARGIHRGDEIELRDRRESGRMALTRFNLVTGKVSTAELGDMPKVEELPADVATAKGAAGKTNTASKSKGVASKTPAKSGASGTAAKPLDPQKLGAAVAGASVPARLAAPATISTAINQQRTMQAMEDMDGPDGSSAGAVPGTSYEFEGATSLIPTHDGFIQFTTKLVERRIEERTAMKAPPKKSALDGNVSVTSTMEVANELLNEMQRNAGGDKVREDVSRYHVKLHVGGAKDIPDWEADVVGKPAVYPQQTINAVVAGKTLVVLDKANKKKWESTLNYPMAGGGSFFEEDEDDSRTGLGPVVEHGDTLYVFDQGVLSAFEAATGNARWRLPSVGITGLYFDDKDMMYVNTTTASPDKIRYSKQIDVTDRTGDIVIKLDSKTGKEIWRYAEGGTIAYLSSKYIFTMSYLGPLDDNEELSPEMVAMGVQTKPYLRIRRINPRNGRVVWDYYQPRGPLDVKINGNTFQVVLKKEVQVLKFLSF